MTFQSVGDFFRKEQQLTVQLESEQFELSGKYRRKIPSVIPFVIDMMNSVHSLPKNLPTDFTDIIYSVGNCVGKNDTSSFFLLCFNFFSHYNSLGIYQRNISVSKISRKFTYENISSVFSFVFIDFLVVFPFSNSYHPIFIIA